MRHKLHGFLALLLALGVTTAVLAQDPSGFRKAVIKLLDDLNLTDANGTPVSNVDQSNIAITGGSITGVTVLSTTGHSLAQSYAGEITVLADASISFDDGAVQTLAISGDTTFTTTTASLSATHARACRIKVTTDGTQRNLTFPGNWKWIGDKPASLALSTSAYLYLTSDGANETDVVARWVVLGTGA